ncbi:Actin-related protein [Corchorus olitorius]|uniref:Actin-related protein n=1 Tax=Corchorus olitorius TaxID=93759 RepID=A0A1R3HBX3_9ROSI|nr:Actin-related protein [Corchorus olitorius]
MIARTPACVMLLIAMLFSSLKSWNMYILDFAFDRLGASGSRIDHPILITECVRNPVYSRSKMAELLFETYRVPAVAFGVDAAVSYKYNQQRGICGKDGLAICPGFNTTHVIPTKVGNLRDAIGQ